MFALISKVTHFRIYLSLNVRKHLRACTPCEDSDQPAHSHSLIRIFTGRILDSQGCHIYLYGQGRLITKTYLYNFDPLKPHFYKVKLGFTGVYIIFLISAQNIYCGYSLEPPPRAVLTSTNNLCFEQKYEKYQSFLSENFQFLEVKFSIYLNRRIFVMSMANQTVRKCRLICVFIGSTYQKVHLYYFPEDGFAPKTTCILSCKTRRVKH